jgi:hypothetical protein
MRVPSPAASTIAKHLSAPLALLLFAIRFPIRSHE